MKYRSLETITKTERDSLLGDSRCPLTGIYLCECGQPVHTFLTVNIATFNERNKHEFGKWRHALVKTTPMPLCASCVKRMIEDDKEVFEDERDTRVSWIRGRKHFSEPYTRRQKVK